MTKIALYGALVGLISLSAQDIDAAKKKLLDEAKARVMSDQIINGPTLKGAPYSALSMSETVQVLADGNRITNTNTTILHRDSQGRERREDSSGAVSISDPVEGFTYTLRPESKTAIKSFLPRRAADRALEDAKKAAARKLDMESLMKAEVPTIMMHSTGGGIPVGVGVIIRDNSSTADPMVENLGTQMFDGISAEGTRRTTTMPAGQIGNEQPIITVYERWYSPDLQMLVMSTRSDPRSGTNIYKLTNINRSEPPPTLFQVPPDYTVTDLTGGRSVSRPEEQ
jgi:hypothetical protein